MPRERPKEIAKSQKAQKKKKNLRREICHPYRLKFVLGIELYIADIVDVQDLYSTP